MKKRLLSFVKSYINVLNYENKEEIFFGYCLYWVFSKLVIDVWISLEIVYWLLNSWYVVNS